MLLSFPVYSSSLFCSYLIEDTILIEALLVGLSSCLLFQRGGFLAERILYKCNWFWFWSGKHQKADWNSLITVKIQMNDIVV